MIVYLYIAVLNPANPPFHEVQIHTVMHTVDHYLCQYDVLYLPSALCTVP